jgi:hypothetical protein
MIFAEFRMAVLVFLALIVVGCGPGSEEPVRSGPGFLGPDDFNGKYDKLPTPIPMGGQSSFTGDAAVTNLSRTIIEEILPTELQLAENTEAPSLHPVIMLFGIQHNLEWTMPGGWSFPLDKAYNEIMLIVPFVQSTHGEYWHNWVVRMYLDWQWAVDRGNVYFGLQKELGQFVRDFATGVGVEYTLEVSKSGIEKWQGSISPETAWMTEAQAQASLENYEAFKEIFKMPVLGAWSTLAGKQWVCSYFDWNMGKGSVRQSRVDHEYKSNFVPNMESWVNTGIMQSEADGGFGLKDLQWRMTTPLPCHF